MLISHLSWVLLSWPSHIHANFLEWTVIKQNDTYKAGRLSHVGQIFFDEELKEVLDKVCPFSCSIPAQIFIQIHVLSSMIHFML